MTTKYTNNKLLAFKKFVNAGIRQVSTGRVKYSQVDKETNIFKYHVGNLALDRTKSSNNPNWATVNALAEYALEQYMNGAIELTQVAPFLDEESGTQYFAVQRQFTIKQNFVGCYRTDRV
jgi:hypothetical protein